MIHPDDLEQYDGPELSLPSSQLQPEHDDRYERTDSAEDSASDCSGECGMRQPTSIIA